MVAIIRSLILNSRSLGKKTKYGTEKRQIQATKWVRRFNIFLFSFKVISIKVNKHNKTNGATLNNKHNWVK